MAGSSEVMRSGMALLAEEMTGEERDRLLDRMVPRKYPFGEVVTEEGVFTDALYVVTDGALKVSVTAEGEVLEVGTVTPGQWVGEVGLLDPGPASATVVAARDSTVLILSAEALEELRHAEPALASPLLRALARTLSERVRASSRGVLRGDATSWRLEHVPQKKEGWLSGVFRSVFGGD
ncbi:MAG: cyclic nucleotide-binding domain-containing protein [Deltaproteobacteria bacterium]|nr:cyclic nucleotide-binding domain-containing protein [Deltaproteobacteria bacterium]MCB9787544.1 cyclic nucleotide-binding domain-containing protein [Deltaproteobacteria bacterium]